MKGLNQGLKLFFILSVISLIFLALDKFTLLKLPKSLVQTLTIPIQYGLYQSGKNLYRQFEFIFLARHAAQQNLALKEQLADLLSENARLMQELAQTKALVTQQESLNPKTFNLLSARPVGVSRYLLIDRGSSDGVSVGQVVVFKQNFIGQIQQVSEKISQVLLSQDPDSKIAVYAQNSAGRAKGILRGRFGAQSLMDKILHLEPISVGDLVYSEGTEGRLPKGLVLGKVSKVLGRENEIFKQAEIESLLDISDLELVFIVRD